MLRRKKMAYSELPPFVVAYVPESAFLKAYDVAESKSIVVWYIDSKQNRQHEVEFSRERGRALSRQERENAFPAQREIVLSTDGAKIRIGNRLEHGTDVRYETYVAFDLVHGARLVECEQVFYAPFLLALEAVVRPAIRETKFPCLYARWTLTEKIEYWVGVLHRIRRQAGERGGNEDVAFSPVLLEKMRTVDSGIDSILASILAELSRMEVVDSNAMRDAFNRRTGASI